MIQFSKNKQVLDIHKTPLPGGAGGGFWNLLSGA